MDKFGANCCPTCCEGLHRFCGQTVTIFTASGGISGSGFTGVLLSVDEACIRLLTSFGLPPACPIGSACTGFERGERERFGFNGFFGGGCGNCDDGFFGNPFGSICVIPTAAVVSYVVPSI